MNKIIKYMQSFSLRPITCGRLASAVTQVEDTLCKRVQKEQKEERITLD